jgi:type IV pilus assembly protein PilP
MMIFRQFKSIHLSYVIFLFLLLSGCGDNSHLQSAKDFVAQTKARPARPIEPIPEIQNVQVEKYSVSQLRDPYQRVVNRTAGDDVPDLHRKKSNLENYSLDSLKLVGIMTEGDHSWAVISTPDNLVYPLALGEYIGQNFGKLVAISNNKISVVETIQSTGGWQKRNASLSITNEEEAAGKKNTPAAANQNKKP